MVLPFTKLLDKGQANKFIMKDLEKFAQKNHIEYSQYDLIIIYNFIKNNYNELLDGNIKKIENIKNKLNPNLYNALLNLYIDYKQKYL